MFALRDLYCLHSFVATILICEPRNGKRSTEYGYEKEGCHCDDPLSAWLGGLVYGIVCITICTACSELHGACLGIIVLIGFGGDH